MFGQYEHHGTLVWANSENVGTEGEKCLCYSCNSFLPGEETNCPIAQALCSLNVEHKLTTPVFKCPEFVIIDE